MKRAGLFMLVVAVALGVVAPSGLFPPSLALAAAPPFGFDPGTAQFTSGGHVVGFTSKDLVAATGSHALRVEFVGAREVAPAAQGAAASADGKAPPLGRVTYRDLWEGITLAYDAPAGSVLRSTYTIAPGADPSRIRLRYNAPIALEGNGALKIAYATGAVHESAPVAWQDIDGRRTPVAVSFRRESETVLGFALGPYDRGRALTIDPTLTWSTFLGGAGWDQALGIAVDAGGHIYVTGRSDATWGAPVRPWAGPAGVYDAFVAKLDVNGALLWNTFLGSAEGADYGYAIAVDATDSVYVTGMTSGTWGTPVRPTGGAFAAKLDTNGALLWNTFLGGGGNAGGYGIAVDASRNVYVTGFSYGTWGSPIRPASGWSDAFVVKLDARGTLLWNTFLGGEPEWDEGDGIAVDRSGNVYVTGWSSSEWGVPIRPWAGMQDAFVARLDASGNLIWNTFLGGTANDAGGGIAVNAEGSVYVSGKSYATWGAPIQTFQGTLDSFAAKLNADGSLLWTTFEGNGNGIAVDAGGNVFVSGLTMLDGDGARLWSTQGTGYDGFFAVDACGGVSIAGSSLASWGSPLRPWSGHSDAYVSRMDNVAAPLISLSVSIAGEVLPAGSVAGTLATCAGNAFAFALVAGAGDTDNALFEIVGSELRTRTALDFRARSSYSVRIRAADSGTLRTETVFAIALQTSRVLWTRSDTGQAILSRVNADTGASLGGSFLYSSRGVGAGWQATSYAAVADTEAYVLWTRAATGQAILWQIDPSLPTGPSQVKSARFLHPAGGVGADWQATSYAHVGSQEGYVLWTRGTTGQAILWQIDPSLQTGPSQIKSARFLHPTNGVGAGWQATSYEHLGPQEGYVLWTRGATGQAILWQIDPSLSTGSAQIKSAKFLHSTSGVGAGWQATSYEHVGPQEGHVLWTRSATGQAIWWQIDPSQPTGPAQVEKGMLLLPAAGVGAPWQATSVHHEPPAGASAQ